MNIYEAKSYWKLLLLLAAAVVFGFSLYIFNKLTDEIALEEKKKVDLIAATFERIGEVESDEYRSFLLEIVKNNKTVPVLLVDSKDNIIAHKNVLEKLDTPRYRSDELYRAEIKAKLHTRLEEMKYLSNPPKEISVVGNIKQYVYYDNSILWKKLKFFPYAQIVIVVLFLLITYFLFSTSRKAEQNQVWVGMSKETAHQLGTPISSMIGWMEYLKSMDANDIDYDMIVSEMGKDVKRLEQITERFSKIGSEPDLEEVDISDALGKTYHYMKKRASSNVLIDFNSNTDDKVKLNIPLFSWVIENLVNNALNAIGAKGEIHITVSSLNGQVLIDVKDSGKGIAKSNFKTVFKPGYTTRKRGWGLGLSLAKRIVEEYHNGKIFVKDSVLNKGTTFRIILDSL